MAIESSTVSVTTSATEIARGGQVIVQSSAGDFYIGASDLTTSTGIKVTVDTAYAIGLKPDETLYAIAASTTAVRVYRSA
jgi:citrate lyase beta subunit